MSETLKSVRSGNNFDILRFIAACLVIITHWYVLVGRKVEEDVLMRISNNSIMLSTLGLKIFFIISGYLITKSLFASKTYTDYAIKRVLRIFPGLIGAVLFCIIVVGGFFTTKNIFAYFSNIETWSFLRNIALVKLQWALPGVFELHPSSSIMGSIWTLVYELMMYGVLIVALEIRLLKQRKLFLLSFFLLIVLYCYINYYPVPDKLKFYLIYTDLDLYHTINFALFFQAGALFYLYKDVIVYRDIYALFALLFWIATWYIKPMSNIGHFLAVPYITFWLAFNPKLSFFNNFGKYGDFSYGVYLYGMAAQQILISMLGAEYPLPILMILSILISFILAYLSWHLVEKPALSLKNRL